MFISWGLLLEAIANDYWSLAFIFARKLCALDENMIFAAHIKEIIESKSSKYGRYAKYSVAEINEFLQNYLDHLFSEVRITVNHFSSCGKPLQEILKSVLQVNPSNFPKMTKKIIFFILQYTFFCSHQLNFWKRQLFLRSRFSSTNVVDIFFSSSAFVATTMTKNAMIFSHGDHYDV